MKRLSLSLLAIVLLAILTATIIIKYHIKSVIREIVRRETNGEYRVNFTSISLNFLRGKVTLKNAELIPVDSTNSRSNYRLKVPGLYFSLGSWRELLFDGKLIVDSLFLGQPHLTLYPPADSTANKKTGVELKDIVDALKKITENLSIRSLRIKNASAVIYNNNGPPVEISQVDFAIENFAERNVLRHQLFYSDDISLRIHDQQWLLPSGHTIGFKKVFFSSKTQFLQLDSCYISMPAGANQQGVALSAEKLLFRSHELSSLFEKDELSIDTLYCKSPVLTLTLPGDRNTNDTSDGLNGSIHQLFGNVRVKFVNIENGQIRLNRPGDNDASYASEKTDLRINDLAIDRDHSPHIRAGNIGLRLNEVNLISSDSLYVLSVKEFGLDGNDLICKDAILSPTIKNKINAGSKVIIPSFLLSDIDLRELVEKRFKATAAVIEGPQIRLVAGAAKRNQSNANEIPVDRIYEALAGLGKMIDVQMLYINNGVLDIRSGPARSTGIIMKDIDASIRLDDLLASTSPLATKRSIKAISIGSIRLNNGRDKIELENFFVNGGRQIGRAKSFEADLSSGARLKGEGIYWQEFSWDDFLRKGRIDVDTIDFRKFSIQQSINENKKGEGLGAAINIRKLNIHDADISIDEKDNAALRAKGTGIVIKELSVANGVSSWSSMAATVKNVSFRDNKKEVTIEQLDVSNKKESTAKNIVYNDGSNFIEVPELKFETNLNSSDPGGLNFSYLYVYKPNIVIHPSTSKLSLVSQRSAATALPAAIINRLTITGGLFNYVSGKNTTKVFVRLDLVVDSLRTEDKNDGSVLFRSASLKIDSIKQYFTKMPVTLDRLELDINKALITGITKGETNLTCLLSGKWDSLSMAMATKKDSFAIIGLSGQTEEFPLIIKAGEKYTGIRELGEKLSFFRADDLFYSDSTTTMKASHITGSGSAGIIEMENVDMRPKIDRETFFKTSPWQKDYLYFTSDKISISKINNRALTQDTAIKIERISLFNPHISSSRDKTIAFQHGREKFMPTQLITTIKIPVRIDSVVVMNLAVESNEISAITNQEGTVPLTNINAVIRNINSRPSVNDSLYILANGRVLEYYIRRFRYAESYSDSLSGFKTSYRFSPMHLPALTEVTKPLSAVAVTRGDADTLYARVAGNKYMAFGEMHFYYRKLRITVLNKHNTMKKGFLASFETLIANSFIIKANNKKKSRVFFVRDRERFVFNYWIKTLFSGIFSSAGAKSNKKYKKLHEQLRMQYSLPAWDD